MVSYDFKITPVKKLKPPVNVMPKLKGLYNYCYAQNVRRNAKIPMEIICSRSFVCSLMLIVLF